LLSLHVLVNLTAR